MTDIFDIPVVTLKGESTTLSDYRGNVLLIVNVASRCGLSPQYAELEQLQKSYGPRGFTVLGFPSNQFFQELGQTEAIAEYCSTTWGVTFPMFDKIKVNGRNRHPLYAELTKAKDSSGSAGNVRWNFEKFLVLPDGTVRRFRPTVVPSDPAIVSVIEANLPR
ncbi:MAG: hypothetical protein RIS25_804 [Actinomycetota bacterium]|jgi:glutathione peroxidase